LENSSDEDDNYNNIENDVIADDEKIEETKT
jgi:hypothetical protein